jgi:hypothetical protein
MSFDWSWPKVTGLLTVQAGSHTAIGLLTAKATEILTINWVQTAEASGLSALVALLGAVVAYKIPSKAATAALSAPVAVQQATLARASLFAADADEAKKT